VPHYGRGHFAASAARCVVTSIDALAAAEHPSPILIDRGKAPMVGGSLRNLARGGLARIQGRVVAHWPLDMRAFFRIGARGVQMFAVITVADASGAADVILAGRVAARFFGIQEGVTSGAR